MTVHHTARAASIAQLAQPLQPLPEAVCTVCRACSVHASTGAPHPTWSPRALTTSREAADQAPRSPFEADLRGAEARGLSYYLYLGSETFSTGPGGLSGLPGALARETLIFYRAPPVIARAVEYSILYCLGSETNA